MTAQSWRLLWLIAFGLLARAAGAQAVIAVQLDEANVDRRLGGYDAVAGIGDWFVSNGVLCAAVSGANHETGLSLWGGELVDLGYCGRADDQLSYTHFLPEMEQQRMLPIERIGAYATETSATLVVERSDGELHSKRSYTLNQVDPHRLSMVTEIKRIGDGDDLSMVGQLWLHPHRALTSFSIDTRGAVTGPGFSYPSFDREDQLDALDALHYTDLTVLVGDANQQPGISYAIHSERAYLEGLLGGKKPVPQYTLVEKDYTNQVWLTRPLWLGGAGDPGRLELFQSLFMDLNVGEVLHIEQSIYVGDAADVASATNHLFRGNWLRGTLDSGPGRVAVFGAQGRPLTEARTDAGGAFRIRLPLGLARCTLELKTPWSEARRIDVQLAGEDLQLPPLATGAPGHVRLPAGHAMRLVFKGRNGTPDPLLGNPLPSYRFDDELVAGPAQGNSLPLTGFASDLRTLALSPGDYRVYATRGPEYAVSSDDIQVVAGTEVGLELAPLQRHVAVDGWISADFHVHSAYSFDATIAPRQQLASFIAQGADLLVATEHDQVADLGRVAAQLGLTSSLTVLSGVEVTGMAHGGDAPRTLGHVNLYPWPRDELAYAGGTPPHEGKRLRQLIGEVKQREQPPLVQLNHPRDLTEQSPDLAFFEHLSIGERYDQRLALRNVQNRSLLRPDPRYGLRDIDFDTYELANGSEEALYRASRADWLALILQGEYRPGLANSDSHDLHRPIAMPRSYVAYAGPRQHPLDSAAVLEAVRAGRVFGSSGPIPRIELRAANGTVAGIGDTIRGRRTTLQVSAQAAPWVGVDQLWVYVNGVVIKGGGYRRGEVVEIPIEVVEDSFVFVEFYGEPGETYAVLAPGHRPMAYTNPIWIDADGDGRWSAPGLHPLPIAVSEPQRIPGSRPN